TIGIVSVPIVSSVAIMWQILGSNITQGLADPDASLRVERGVVGIIQQLRDCAAALLFTEHAGLRQATGGTLAHHGRRVVMQSLQQRRNALVGAEERQTFDGPVARFLIGIFEMTDQDLSNPLGDNPAIAKQTWRRDGTSAFALAGGS